MAHLRISADRNPAPPRRNNSTKKSQPYEGREKGVENMEKTCPKCGGRLVRICYGLPSSETFEKADRRELFLGGCRPGKYDFHCYQCDRSYTEDLGECDSPE